MHAPYERWKNELAFWVASLGLAYIFFYLTTHRRPQLTIVVAVGFVVTGYLFSLVLKQAKWALYAIFFVFPFYPFIRVQLLRFEVVGETVMFFISRWTEAVMIMALLGRKWGGVKRVFYSAPLLDFLTTAFILYGLGHLFYAIEQGNWMMALWGMKEDFLFYLYYFLVRFVPLDKRDLKRFIAISAPIAAGIALFGIVQSQFFGEDFLLKLGYGVELKGTGITYLTHVHQRGDIHGTGGFIRAISILQDPLSLAAYLMMFSLILQPFYFLPPSAGYRHLKTLLYLVILAGMFFTTTRSAWLGTALGVFLIAWRTKRLLVTLGTFSLLAIVGLSILLMLPGGRQFLIGTFTLEEGSAFAHYSKYAWHFGSMLRHPMGMGLGMAGRIATQFGAQALGGYHTECWYLQIGGEMGIPAFLLYISIVLETMRKLFSLTRTLIDPFLNAAATGIFAAYTALAVFGIFLNVWTCHLVPVFMHLFVGIALFHFPALDRQYRQGYISLPPDMPRA